MIETRSEVKQIWVQIQVLHLTTDFTYGKIQSWFYFLTHKIRILSLILKMSSPRQSRETARVKDERAAEGIDNRLGKLQNIYTEVSRIKNKNKNKLGL